jgi:hypothetical protein
MATLQLVYGYKIEVSQLHEMADCCCERWERCHNFAHYVNNLDTAHGISTYATGDPLLLICGITYSESTIETGIWFAQEQPDVSTEVKTKVQAWCRGNGFRTPKKYILVDCTGTVID